MSLVQESLQLVAKHNAAVAALSASYEEVSYRLVNQMANPPYCDTTKMHCITFQHNRPHYIIEKLRKDHLFAGVQLYIWYGTGALPKGVVVKWKWH